MREIYSSHLKLMDLFRLYVRAPSASAISTEDQAANKRYSGFIAEKKKTKTFATCGKGTEAGICVIKDNAITLYIAQLYRAL